MPKMTKKPEPVQMPGDNLKELIQSWKATGDAATGLLTEVRGMFKRVNDLIDKFGPALIRNLKENK